MPVLLTLPVSGYHKEGGDSEQVILDGGPCGALRLAAGPLADVSGKRAKEAGLALGIQVVDLSPGGHAAAFDVRADQLDDQRPRSRMNALHPDRLRAECRAPGEGRGSEAGGNAQHVELPVTELLHMRICRWYQRLPRQRGQAYGLVVPFANRGPQTEIAVRRGGGPCREFESRHAGGQGDGRDLELCAPRARDGDLDRARPASPHHGEMTAGAGRGPAVRATSRRHVTDPGPGKLPVLQRVSHVHRSVGSPLVRLRCRVKTAHEQSNRPAAKELGERTTRGILQVRSPAQPRMDQGRHQLWTVLVNAPPQKKISASPIAMAAEQVGRIVVFHHELVAFGLRQEGADAVVDVGARKSLRSEEHTSESLIQPALFLEYDRT